MLTKTSCDFWVVMNDRTPAFPNPGYLPYLIEDPQTKQFRFELTHPFDNRVLTFQTACSAASKIEFLMKYPDVVNELKNAYPFRIECSVRIATAGEASGHVIHDTPRESFTIGPDPNLVQTHRTKFKTVKFMGKHREGTSEFEISIDDIVPWKLKNSEKETIGYFIFHGNQIKYNMLAATIEEAFAMSYEVDQETYDKIYPLYKKFQDNPYQFIIEEGESKC